MNPIAREIVIDGDDCVEHTASPFFFCRILRTEQIGKLNLVYLDYPCKFNIGGGYSHYL